jgi:hypothetical protein
VVYKANPSHFLTFKCEHMIGHQGQTVLIQEEPRGPSILIEVNVQTNGLQRVPFPDISQLRSTTTQKIVIKGLRLISSEILTNAIIAPNATAPVTELQKMAVTIYSEGWEKGQTIPILTFNDFAFTIGAIPYRNHSTKFSNWTSVDWPKSYLQFANGTVSAGTPYTVLLDCEYLRYDASNNLLIGPSM